jgi:hypothetical protein
VAKAQVIVEIVEVCRRGQRDAGDGDRRTGDQ